MRHPLRRIGSAEIALAARRCAARSFELWLIGVLVAFALYRLFPSHVFQSWWSRLR